MNRDSPPKRAPARRGLLLITATLLAMALLAGEAISISVAPHAVFLDQDRLTAELTLFNGSNNPEEVDIGFVFGYPQARANGTMEVPLIEEPGSDEPSAVGWLRAFPRRLRVEPGQRRVVRVQATPPTALEDGEYWARLVVTSREVRARAAGPDTTASTGLKFVFRNVLSLNFRNGAVHTGLEFDSLWVEAASDTMKVWVDLNRTGNSAFLGSTTLTLTTPDGAPVWEAQPVNLAVYRSLRRWYAIPAGAVEPGDYRLTVRISTDRADLNPDDVLPAPAVERSLTVSIP